MKQDEKLDVIKNAEKEYQMLQDKIKESFSKDKKMSANIKKLGLE